MITAIEVDYSEFNNEKAMPHIIIATTKLIPRCTWLLLNQGENLAAEKESE
jgi:hypothetical protein